MITVQREEAKNLVRLQTSCRAHLIMTFTHGCAADAMVWQQALNDKLAADHNAAYAELVRWRDRCLKAERSNAALRGTVTRLKKP